MDDKRAMLRHYLGALAYRTQKALRGAPTDFGTFRIAPGVRNPMELVQHMTSVLGYARTFFIGATYWPEALPTLDEEIDRFHEVLADLADRCTQTEPFPAAITAEQLLQGPFADAMTHAGQLAMLRRLHGAPVPPENFVFARVDPNRLGRDQPEPAQPDKVWHEAPPDWVPPT